MSPRPIPRDSVRVAVGARQGHTGPTGRDGPVENPISGWLDLPVVTQLV